MDDQLKALGTGHQLAPGATWRTSLMSLLLGTPSAVNMWLCPIPAYLTRDGRRGTLQNSGNMPQAHALGSTHLNGGAFFNAEFDV